MTIKIYHGAFKNDELHGYEVYVWPNGKTYSGYWLNFSKNILTANFPF